MPVGAVLGAAAIAGGVSAYTSSKSNQTQRESANQAIDYAKEQEAQRRKEWEIQSKAAQHQWDVQQANLAPYRAARAAILRKHGIEVPDYVAPPMPEGYGGVPSTFGGTVPAPSAKKGGGAGGAIALGLLGGAANAVGSYYANRPSYNGLSSGPTTAGLSTGGVGYQMSPLTIPAGTYGGPAGPPSYLAGSGSGIVPTSSLPNWSNYSGTQQYGVPGQNYYGE